ncbi:hypothetical protein BTO30_04615 [Domibacillus antri]|uniref:Pilus assembly protein PilZ n=1 Tax=Domibacillus antri TaxID=1714264 RepID=A0A1Q8Q855_9BACI|nr:flagellar brake domain-containing protein [Domibacillus antri]OLN23518.1 hypothetical protein BTO30_04615 [Domibacillus antri]
MLEVGVTMLLETFDAASKKEEYRCKVTDLEDGKIYIDYPINVETNKTVFMLDGMQLAANFIDPASSAAVCMFRTEVLGRVKKKIPMLMLRDPGQNEYIRVQRRKFVRVQTAVDVAVQFDGKPSFATVTDDISAGGAAVLLPHNTMVEEGAEACLYVVIPSSNGENQYLELKASLVRVHSNDKSDRRTASLQFQDISHHDQQLLMRFCFEKQLQLRKKGLE